MLYNLIINLMEPKKECALCSRLVDLRNKNKLLFPNFFNDRVLGIGPLNSKLLIIGLDPGYGEQVEQIKFLTVTFQVIYFSTFLKNIILQIIMMNLMKSEI